MFSYISPVAADCQSRSVLVTTMVLGPGLERLGKLRLRTIWHSSVAMEREDDRVALNLTDRAGQQRVLHVVFETLSGDPSSPLQIVSCSAPEAFLRHDLALATTSDKATGWLNLPVKERAGGGLEAFKLRITILAVGTGVVGIP